MKGFSPADESPTRLPVYDNDRLGAIPCVEVDLAVYWSSITMYVHIFVCVFIHLCIYACIHMYVCIYIFIIIIYMYVGL